MSKGFLKKLAIMIFAAFLFCPSSAYLQENSNVIHPQQKIIIAMKYGEKNGEFGYKSREPGGFFTAPKAFAFDSDKDIYIADSAQKIPRIIVFNDRGELVRIINVDAKIRRYIQDIAIHDKRLYVLADNIQVLTLSGQLIQTIKYVLKYDVTNYEAGKEWTAALNNPTRLEIDTKGDVYLSTEASALVKLSPEGAVLQHWSWVDHYLDPDGNLFIMNFFEKGKNGKVVQYGADGKKIAESTCDAMFATPPNQKCKLPTFIDNKGRMYRIFSQSFADPNTIITRYTKQQSTLLGVVLYRDEDGYYYKVDDSGNIYTIQVKGNLVKYVSPE